MPKGKGDSKAHCEGTKNKHRTLDIHGSTHRVPPKHFWGDPDDLKARIAAANPTQELSLVEVGKRLNKTNGVYAQTRTTRCKDGNEAGYYCHFLGASSALFSHRDFLSSRSAPDIPSDSNIHSILMQEMHNQAQ